MYKESRDKNINFKQVEDLVDFKDILDQYKEYKTGYSNDKIYREKLVGIISINPFFLS